LISRCTLEGDAIWSSDALIQDNHVEELFYGVGVVILEGGNTHESVGGYPLIQVALSLLDGVLVTKLAGEVLEGVALCGGSPTAIICLGEVPDDLDVNLP